MTYQKIDGTSVDYTIPANAENLTIRMKMAYSDGSDIIDVDGNNLTTSNIQEVSYSFGGPVETTYTVGLERIQDRYVTNGVVAMIGDSTTDSQAFGGTDNRASRMFAQSLISWRPTKWKGTTVPLSATNGVRVGPQTSGVNSVSGVTPTPTLGTSPGNIEIFDNIDAGWNPNTGSYYTAVSGAASGYLFRTAVNPNGNGINEGAGQFSMAGEIMGEEADGTTKVWYQVGENYKYRVLYGVTTETLNAGSALPGASVMDDIQLNLTVGNNAFSWGGVTRTSSSVTPNATMQYKRATIEAELTAAPADASALSWFSGPYMTVKAASNGSWGQDGDSAFLPVTSFVERTDITEGLTLVDLATSGFKLPQHRYEPSENNPLTIAGSGNALGYTDAVLEEYYSEFQIDTVHIMSGINDANMSSPNNNAENYKSNVEAIIQRHKDAHAAAGVSTSLKFLLVSAPDWNTNSGSRTVMATYPAKLREIALADEDVAYLNMFQWFADTYGPYAAYSSTMLYDGVHQTLETGNIFAAQIWDFIANGDS
jgi:lysophospholipase L1-like esterase